MATDADRKAVIVTGAAGGIGRAACERLAASGWNVLAVDCDADKLSWTSGREHIVSFSADVTVEADNQQMIRAADEHFGRLDALILNAGIGGSGRIDELPFTSFERVIAVNLFGPVHGVRAALPMLRRQQESSIVITSSAMGLGAEAENSAYCSSKHAVIGLVRSLARELGWEGIRVNALCPGATQSTGLNEDVETRAPDRYEQLRRNIPLQRWADPNEMASVLEFLISPAASYINGMALAADGGAHAGTGLLPPKAGDEHVMPPRR